MLLCGVLLLGMTTITRAATLNVRATVLGNPPAYAAQITKPKNNQRFSKIPIAIEGTCPPVSIVKIYRNDHFSGSVLCSASNTFSLSSDLFEGKNTLISRVFNYADVEGPVSEAVVAYYDKPVEKPPIGVAQLFLDSDTRYRAYFTNQKIDWPLEIGGGKAPYALSIDWGDGKDDVISLAKAGNFTVSHIYTKPGTNKGSYTITVKASDSQGGKAYLEIVIIVSDIKTAASTTSAGSGDIDTLSFWENLYKQILIMWPFYITAALMLTSFWLGERQGYNNLWNRFFGKSRRAH